MSCALSEIECSCFLMRCSTCFQPCDADVRHAGAQIAETAPGRPLLDFRSEACGYNLQRKHHNKKTFKIITNLPLEEGGLTRVMSSYFRSGTAHCSITRLSRLS